MSNKFGYGTLSFNLAVVAVNNEYMVGTLVLLDHILVDSKGFAWLNHY
jgi:hypothetical protein